MTVLLLSEQLQGSYVIPRRPTAHDRLVVRVRAWSLDAALSGGASPDSTAALSLRAQWLISEPFRRRLARTIRGLVRDAHHPPPPATQSVRICSRKVRAAGAVLEELADRLVDPHPVEARGVARVRLLLCDGTGPVYAHPDRDDLRPALGAALQALELRLQAQDP